MPRPTSSTTVQRPDLGTLAYEYMLDASQRGFIGLRVMPAFEVPEKSADYPVLPIESMLKVPDTKRAPKGHYNRGDWEFETGTYDCIEYGWEEPIDDVELSLYQRFFDAEMVSTEIAVDHILRDHEKRVATKLQTGGSDNDVTNEWDDATNAKPRADVEDAKSSMRAASGLTPNALVISHKVFRNLLQTNEITGAFKYTNPIEIGGEEAQRRILAQYFGVGAVLIGNAIYDAAKKGQSMSLTDIWDDEYAHLMVISNGSPRLREPAYGRTFLWFEDAPQEVVVESYREEDIRSTIVRARQHVDEAVIFSGAKYTLGNITS